MAEQAIRPMPARTDHDAHAGIAAGRSARRRRFDSQWLLLVPVALFVALAMAGPFLAGDPSGQELANRLRPPLLAGGTWDHPLGTDGLGRDVLSRVMEGARLSLFVGLAAAGISAAIGVAAGLAAGAFGSIVDAFLTALVELTLSVPTIVIGIVLVATLGQSMTNLVAILVISGWIGYARVVRLQARSLMRAEFVTASQAIGAGRLQIAWRHVLPNLLPVIVVLACQQVAAVMLWEASLTYLGIGLPIERISLGGMVRDGQERVFDGWWISLYPGLAIALAVVGFNLLADWLQVRLDPVRRSWRKGGGEMEPT